MNTTPSKIPLIPMPSPGRSNGNVSDGFTTVVIVVAYAVLLVSCVVLFFHLVVH